MEEKKIYQCIPAIMADIKHISKDKRNTQQGFMFRGIDQVMNTMKPLLAKHGVFVVPEVIDRQREERASKNGSLLIYSILTVRHHFVASDGSEVCSVTVGEGMDSADKASNKAMAIAFKYACFQVFCIPTEEMANDDPDAYSPEPTPKKPTPAPQPQPAPAPTPAPAPMAKEDIFDIEQKIGTCKTVKELGTLWHSISQEEQQALANSFSQRKAEILIPKK